MKKDIPKLFDCKKKCCGCGACFSICPKKAIKMIPDETGFEYPEIDDSKCICCNRCKTVCSINTYDL